MNSLNDLGEAQYKVSRIIPLRTCELNENLSNESHSLLEIVKNLP